MSDRSERRGGGAKGGHEGKGIVCAYLHLFKKLSMLLFFLRAGKSRSYTSASKPSCGGREGVEEMNINTAACHISSLCSSVSIKNN